MIAGRRHSVGAGDTRRRLLRRTRFTEVFTPVRGCAPRLASAKLSSISESDFRTLCAMTTSQSLISKTSSSRDKSPSVSATRKLVKSKVSSQGSRSKVRPPKPSAKSASPASSSSSPSTSVEQSCAHCGRNSVTLKHVTRSFGKGPALLVIEAIPMWSCASCGESYFSAKTMHEIERIKTLRKAVAIKRAVAVAAFEVVSD